MRRPSAAVDEVGTAPRDDGAATDTPDLLRVALAAYAAHLEKHARVRIPRATTPWGRAARIANLRRFDAR